MNQVALLQRIKELYQKKDINIIEYLKKQDGHAQTSRQDIMISYDFQAGSYVNAYKKAPDKVWTFVQRLASCIEELPGEKQSIFEPGIGEATTFAALMAQISIPFVFSGGADVSWSRIKTAQQFVEEMRLASGMPSNLVLGDMFELPLEDNAVDIVYTVHAIEPNGGREKEILTELYRITNEYLILLEPAYELANTEARQRMERHGYIQNLYRSAKELGYDILIWELYGMAMNPLNPTGFLVIKKRQRRSQAEGYVSGFSCPITKTRLEKIGNAFFSKESLLAYPIVNEVPCLMKEYAVVATKMNELYGR